MLEYLLSGSISATCLVAMVAGLCAYWLLQRRKYNYPPGPTTLPLIGNFLQIDQSKLHEQAFEWSKKYGPVITIKLGRIPFIYVNHIDAALEVLVKKSIDFAGRMSSPSFDILTFGGKSMTFSSYGPTYKIHRRIASKALRYYMQGNALDDGINAAVTNAFVEMDKETGEFDPAVYINFIVANILTGLCFGGKYSFCDEEILYLLNKEDELIKLLGEGTLEDYIPGLKYVYKTKAFQTIEKHTDDLFDKFLRKKYNETKCCFQRDRVSHFSDFLTVARLEAIEEEGRSVLDSLTDDHMVQLLADIFFAGVDTSRYTLSWAIKHMLAFPDIQEKVQDEIDRVVGKDRLPTMNDRPELGYTEAVLHESMRVATVAATGIMHMTACDTDVAGYKIPKGTAVVINHWALHHDPDAWEDVERFIPERFLDENGKLGPKPKNWLPFSAGKRGCLGEFIAKPQLHLLFASLMQRYTWKMKSGKHADLTPAGNSFGLTSKPYKVIVKRRI